MAISADSIAHAARLRLACVYSAQKRRNGLRRRSASPGARVKRTKRRYAPHHALMLRPAVREAGSVSQNAAATAAANQFPKKSGSGPSRCLSSLSMCLRRAIAHGRDGFVKCRENPPFADSRRDVVPVHVRS